MNYVDFHCRPVSEFTEFGVNGLYAATLISHGSSEGEKLEVCSIESCSLMVSKGDTDMLKRTLGNSCMLQLLSKH